MNFKHLILFLHFAFFFEIAAYPQQAKIDVARKKMTQYPKLNENWVDAINELAFYYHTVNADSTMLFASKALVIATKLNYIKGIADAYKHIAIAHYVHSEGDTAIKINQRALKLYEDLGEKKGQGAVLNNIAIIYHSIGKYDESIQMHQQALKIRLAIGDSSGIAGSYNNIANCYTDKGDYVMSLKNLFNGLMIREQMQDTAAMANSYANIGGVYYLIKRYDDAYINAKKAHDLQLIIGDKEGLIQSLIAIGGVLVDKGQYVKGFRNFMRSLKLAKECGNVNGEIISYINLAEVYSHFLNYDSAIYLYHAALNLAIKSGDLPNEAISNVGLGKSNLLKGSHAKSIPFLEKGFKLAKEIGNRQFEFEASKDLAFAYEKIGILPKALFFYKESLSLKDSIFSEENARKTDEIGFNYMLEKKQNEIILLEKDRSIQQAKSDWNRLLTLALIIIIAVLILFVYYINFYRLEEVKAKELILKQKSEIEIQAAHLEELNLLKNKTFSILSHDLKNPICSLTNVLELLDEEVLTEADFNKLRSSFRSQLKSLNLLLDNTLNWAKNQMNGEVKTSKVQVNILPLVLQNFDLFKQFADQKNITLTHEISKNHTSLIDQNHLDIAFRNILHNAIKFTHPGGKVMVRTEDAENYINLAIVDNGIGMSTTQINSLFNSDTAQGNFGTAGENGAGIGLILSNDFITKNGGKLCVRSEINSGTEFMISLPKGA